MKSQVPGYFGEGIAIILAQKSPPQHHEVEFGLTYKANSSYTPSQKKKFLSTPLQLTPENSTPTPQTKEAVMMHTYKINGLPVQTGDLICTTDGGEALLSGQFWWLIGKIIPGDVDHIVIYVGPEGRCVEAGAKFRVITFEVKDNKWDSNEMNEQRNLIDILYGVAYPLKDKNLTESEEAKIRNSVASYCLAQAKAEKPYNLNFLNSQTEDAFYCSQLAYKAYLSNGIDMNTGIGVPNIPGTSSIIFPQEIWSGCNHKKA